MNSAPLLAFVTVLYHFLHGKSTKCEILPLIFHLPIVGNIIIFKGKHLNNRLPDQVGQ